MSRRPSQHIDEPREMNVRAVWAFTHSPTRFTIPLYTSRISAGFPSPADDWLESRLDLNRWLIDHPAATFMVRVEGDSMIGEKIYDGDVLVVDRMVEADDGDVVVARLGCEMCVKKLKIVDGEVWLMPANELYQPIRITEDLDFAVWGKVLHVIHSLKKQKSNGLGLRPAKH